MSIETGGKTVYGASIGILMLDTHFPRIPGDIGNALTWPFPVQYRIVRGATPEKVVQHNAELLTDDFIAAAQDLVESGADGITTNCGFLSLIQRRVSAAIGIPVATSSLMQVPWIQSLLPPGRRVGVLTICQSTLTEAHLTAAHVPLSTPIVGTDMASVDHARYFSNAILGNKRQIDFTACRADNLAAAQELVTQHNDIGAIVLECTNMVPYAADIRKLTGLPVYSIYTFINWFQSGLMPRRFSSSIDDSAPALQANFPSVQL